MKKIIKPGLFDYYSVDLMRETYDKANEELILSGRPVDVLFIGDSVTYNWNVTETFKEFGNVVNRGISGDVIQILARRFEADALQLNPRVIVLLAGVNSTYNLLSADVEKIPAMVEEQFSTFAKAYEQVMDMCRAAGQFVIPCAVTPLAEQPSPATDMRRKTVVRQNEFIKSLCDKYGCPFADYHTPMAEFDGMTAQPRLTLDGLHPNACGYERMDRVIRPILRAALATV